MSRPLYPCELVILSWSPFPFSTSITRGRPPTNPPKKQSKPPKNEESFATSSTAYFLRRDGGKASKDVRAVQTFSNRHWWKKQENYQCFNALIRRRLDIFVFVRSYVKMGLLSVSPETKSSNPGAKTTLIAHWAQRLNGQRQRSVQTKSESGESRLVIRGS